MTMLPDPKDGSDGKDDVNQYFCVILYLDLMLYTPFASGERSFFMETRLAVISIILHNRSRSSNVNNLLSDYGDFIIGRMGLPYKEKNVYVMSIVIDATNDIINSLTGKLGKIDEISVKALFAK